MEKFKAKMMGHFLSVRVEYQEPSASFPNSCSSWQGGSHTAPPMCRRWCRPSKLRVWVSPREPQSPPLHPRRQETALPWSALDASSQLLQSLLQPLTPDLRFFLARCLVSKSREHFRGDSFVLRQPFLRFVLTYRENRLMVPIRPLCPRHSFSTCPSKKSWNPFPRDGASSALELSLGMLVPRKREKRV